MPQRYKSEKKPPGQGVVQWTAGTLYGGGRALFGVNPKRKTAWVEIITGDRYAFIIRKYRDAGDKGEKLIAEKVTNARQIDPIWDAKARELGFPGAGYAMEIGEGMLS